MNSKPEDHSYLAMERDEEVLDAMVLEEVVELLEEGTVDRLGDRPPGPSPANPPPLIHPFFAGANIGAKPPVPAQNRQAVNRQVAAEILSSSHRPPTLHLSDKASPRQGPYGNRNSVENTDLPQPPAKKAKVQSSNKLETKINKRVGEFPGEGFERRGGPSISHLLIIFSFHVFLGTLYCTACFEELALKKSTLDTHVVSTKHREGLKKIVFEIGKQASFLAFVKVFTPPIPTCVIFLHSLCRNVKKQGKCSKEIP